MDNAKISRNTNFNSLDFAGESKQLADPDVLKRLTSSVRYFQPFITIS